MVSGASQRTEGEGETIALDLLDDLLDGTDIRVLATCVERQQQEPVAVGKAGVGIGDETLAV